MGVFRRAAPMVGALFFVATLALVAVFDSEVRLDTRCQTASWRLRSAATKGRLRGGRGAVDAALAEMGCLPDARAAVVREIAAGGGAAAAARAGARTASPSIPVDPGARASGAESGADVPRAEVEGGGVEKSRARDALLESSARAWEEFRRIVGNASDAEREAYPETQPVSPFPETEPARAVGTWDECGACDACVVGDVPETKTRARQKSDAPQRGGGGRRSLFAANAADAHEPSRGDLNATEPTNLTSPRCGTCVGCSHVLRPLRLETRFGPFRYANEPGATAASVFAVDSAHASGGAGVAKTPCFAKRYADGREYKQGTCGGGETPTEFAAQVARDLARNLAVSKLAERCGLEDVSVRQWREKVRTAHPLSGEKFEGDALFMDRAPGVSLEKLTRSPPDKLVVGGEEAEPPSHVRLVHDVLAAVDSGKIRRSALFDFLFGQCDRHAQNALVTAEGDFAFIDNDQSLGRGWKGCVANSFLIPGSEKFTIARFGNRHVNGDAAPDALANPQVVLDYRCHAGERGEIGFGFPAKFAACAEWLAEDADVAQVVEEFGFPSSADAEFVVQRARSLRKRGFEGALRRAQYDASRSGGDASHRVFGWPEPCCALTETREREKLVGYTCANQTTPACDGGYAACQGARDAAFFEESAKIE